MSDSLLGWFAVVVVPGLTGLALLITGVWARLRAAHGQAGALMHGLVPRPPREARTPCAGGAT